MAFLCDGCKRVGSQANDEHSTLVNSGNLLSQLLGALPCVLPLSASTIRAKGGTQLHPRSRCLGVIQCLGVKTDPVCRTHSRHYNDGVIGQKLCQLPPGLAYVFFFKHGTSTMCEGSLNGEPRLKVVGGRRCYYYDYHYYHHIYDFMLLFQSSLLLRIIAL